MKRLYDEKQVREAINKTEALIYSSLTKSLNEQVKDPALVGLLFSAIDPALQSYRTSLESMLDL